MFCFTQQNPFFSQYTLHKMERVILKITLFKFSKHFITLLQME